MFRLGGGASPDGHVPKLYGYIYKRAFGHFRKGLKLKWLKLNNIKSTNTMKTTLKLVLVAMLIFWAVEDGYSYKRMLRRRYIRRPKPPRSNWDCHLNRDSPACDDVRGRGRRDIHKVSKIRNKSVFAFMFFALFCWFFFSARYRSILEATNFSTKGLLWKQSMCLYVSWPVKYATRYCA